MLPIFKIYYTIRNTSYIYDKSLLLLSWLVGKNEKIQESPYMNNAEMQI